MTPPTEPEGWVLVPREPTEAMQRAAHYELGVWRGSDDACMLGFEGAAKAYRLMIEAAPPAPVEPMRKALEMLAHHFETGWASKPGEPRRDHQVFRRRRGT